MDRTLMLELAERLRQTTEEFFREKQVGAEIEQTSDNMLGPIYPSQHAGFYLSVNPTPEELAEAEEMELTPMDHKLSVMVEVLEP